jgi:hypothetical protein
MRWMQNGYHTIAILPIAYIWSHDLFLATSLFMKLYSANYWYYYASHYDYIKPPYAHLNAFKQFIRFTDTGHLVSLLYCVVDKSWLPIAYNVHGIITCGYWFGKFFLDMPDADAKEIPGLHHGITNTMSYLTHVVPYAMIVREALFSDCSGAFSTMSLLQTYLWFYTWFVCIYLPWRCYTGDYVYSIFKSDANYRVTGAFVLGMHFFVYLLNTSGSLLCNRD